MRVGIKERKQIVAVVLAVFGAMLLAMVIPGPVLARVPPEFVPTNGIYIQYDDPSHGLDPGLYPVIGGYRRYSWKDIETSNNSFNWDGIAYWISQEQAHGKYVGIGFTTYNEHGNVVPAGPGNGTQVPEWLISMYPSVAPINTRRQPDETYRVTNYKDTNYRNYYSRFINAFAQWLADNPSVRARVAWVSMGVGMSGETQPSAQRTSELPDYQFYQINLGLTSAEWVEYVNWCTQTYRDAFVSRGLHIPLFLDIGPTYMGASERYQFSQYAADRGVGLRHNGLMADHCCPINYRLMHYYGTYSTTVPIAWETYSNYVTCYSEMLFATYMGLSAHADNFALTRDMIQIPAYREPLEFMKRYSGVTIQNTPSVWAALRGNCTGGDPLNYEFWLRQFDSAANGTTVKVCGESEPILDPSTGYKFDLPNGTYTVQLHFAELYYSGTGARYFNIVIEGNIVRSNLDVVAAAGGWRKALVLDFPGIVVTDGQLNIDLIKTSGDDPFVNGIYISGPGYQNRVNCGWQFDYRDPSDNIWHGDQEYRPGAWGHLGGYPWVSGVEIAGTDMDPLYQSCHVRDGTLGVVAEGRWTRRTDQASGNSYMRFDIDNGYMYNRTNFTTATITVTYYDAGTDRWQLLYDSQTDANKAAVPMGSTNPWVQKTNSHQWKKAVFYLEDALFAGRQYSGTDPNYGPFSIDFSIFCNNDGNEYIHFVEVSKAGAPTPTATINGSVTLERGTKTPPDPSFSVPLTVTLHTPGNPTPLYTYNPTTDQSGNFTITDIPPGSYDVRVKNRHTLQNVSRSDCPVTLVAGANAVNMGTLWEGDANDDNRVNSSDFIILRNTYLKQQGDPGYDGRADFNEDQRVNSSDFILLRNHYLQDGPRVVNMGGCPGSLVVQSATTPVSTQGDGTITFVPTETTVIAGQEFVLDISVDTGSQDAVAADVFVDFDPAYLEVTGIEDGSPLQVIVKQYDNEAGSLKIGAVTLGEPANGGFTVARLHLRARAQTAVDGTVISFSRDEPRRTVVKNASDEDILATVESGTVHVNAAPLQYQLYVPIICKWL